MIYPHYALELEGLTVSFDGFKAVNCVTLYVAKDELRVIIGPNGAGKTTLLDLICGRTRPTDGRITFMDKVLTRLPEQEIVRAGVVRKFQTPSIYPKLSVLENLELSHPKGRTAIGAIFFKRTPDVVERIHMVAEQIFLKDLLTRVAEQLSHGQKQWLEIGMLLMADPQMLLLDEPVAGMSVREREQTAELLRGICKGRSAVVIEHDMKFVRRIADKVTVMHQGKVLAEGHMDDIEKDPRVIEVYLGH